MIPVHVLSKKYFWIVDLLHKLTKHVLVYRYGGRFGGLSFHLGIYFGLKNTLILLITWDCRSIQK